MAYTWGLNLPSRAQVLENYRRCTVADARTLYELWKAGKRTKKQIELRTFQDVSSNGKRITQLWFELLGKDTEEKSILMKKYEELAGRVENLEKQLEELRRAQSN